MQTKGETPCGNSNKIPSMNMFMSTEGVDDLQMRKIIVIGSVGSGKTSMARYVAGIYGPSDESSMSGHSVTKGVHIYKGKYLAHEGTDTKIQYSIADTEGYGADNFSSENLQNQLMQALRFETELNCIIIVVSFERFRNGLREDLNLLIGQLQTLGLTKEHTLLCFTHCELFTDEVRQKYIEEFRTYFSFDITAENIIFGCFTNIREVRKEFVDVIGPIVKNSIYDVRKALLRKQQQVNVAMEINRIERGAKKPEEIRRPSKSAAKDTVAPSKFHSIPSLFGDHTSPASAPAPATTSLGTVQFNVIPPK